MIIYVEAPSKETAFRWCCDSVSGYVVQRRCHNRMTGDPQRADHAPTPVRSILIRLGGSTHT